MDDHLEIVAETANEFEAHAIASVLEEAGIDPLIADNPGDNQPLTSSQSVKVLVHPERADEARQLLAETRRQVDQDEIADEDPMVRRGMPLLARVAFGVAILVVAVTIVATILMLVL